MTLEEIFEEWMALSEKLYPNTTAEACIIHAVEECCEASKENNVDEIPIEVADIFFCVLTFCKLKNINPRALFGAIEIKFNINKNRKWKQNADKTYSHE